MAITYQTDDFSKEQLEQLDIVLSCAEELLNALTVKPDYLRNEPLCSCEDGDHGTISPTDIAVRIAEYLSENNINCFLPTRVVSEASGFPIEFVTDTFAPPKYIEEDGNE